ncbi:hypothetical protein ACP4OV_020426 [Aristida adscensionis]
MGRLPGASSSDPSFKTLTAARRRRGRRPGAGAMELLRDSIPMVSVAVAAAALYTRAASSRLRPGVPRLAALLPVIAFLAAAPLAFAASANVRGTAAFFLAWLGVFKVALLAAGRGPLDPALPALQFVFAAALPVKLRRHGAAARPAPKARWASLASCAVKVAVVAALLRVYQFAGELNLYVRLALYGVHIYCFLDLLLPFIAGAGAGVLGMEMEPQFDRPLLAASLRDFWGRRWNLVVSAILRPSVYEPMRARAGKAPAAMAAFLVSGLMHEAMVCYITLRPPTGEMAAFFLLHGGSCVAEALCARRWAARGWPPPPRPVVTLLGAGYIAGTAFWLFFPPLCRDGSEEVLLQEWAAAAEYLAGAGQKLLGFGPWQS